MSLRAKVSGISLVEIGLLMVFISLAMVPVVQMIGGPSGEQGGVTRLTGLKSREAILANTLVEHALSNDFSQFECDGAGNPVSFNPLVDLPTDGNVETFSPCLHNNYNNELWSEWTVQHMDQSNNGFSMPQQNRYYQATLNVKDGRSGDVLLTLPTYFFYNEGAYNTSELKTGVLLAIDSSKSMLYSGFDASTTSAYDPDYYPYELARYSWSGSESQIDHNWAITQDAHYRVGLPFMFYRYDNNRFSDTARFPDGPGNVPAGIELNMWDDSQLDLFFGQQIGSGAASDPEPSTAYNEAFPYYGTGVVPANGGLLGMGNCTKKSAYYTESDGDYNWEYDARMRHIFTPSTTMWSSTQSRAIDYNLCSHKSSTSDWDRKLNETLSRIEASRTAALALLVNMESNPNLLPNIEMGYLDWDSTTKLEVAMEPAQMISDKLHFKKTRERLLWLNRADPAAPFSPPPTPPTGPPPVQKCTDSNATNYGQEETCEYYCSDSAAANYGANEKCKYKCTDTNAYNYGQLASCKYPCNDTKAVNYGANESCKYKCTDTNAYNYGDIGSCKYPCKDSKAYNYGANESCKYPCKDSDAINYGANEKCQYDTGPPSEASIDWNWFQKIFTPWNWTEKAYAAPINQSILPSGETRIDLALREAAAELNSKSYNRRIIVLLTDGAPFPATGDNTPDSLVNYAYSIGNGEPDPDKQITIFTVGLIQADPVLLGKIANATPNGASFTANSITELTPIFEQIAYQTQKIALLNTSDRYGVSF